MANRTLRRNKPGIGSVAGTDDIPVLITDSGDVIRVPRVERTESDIDRSADPDDRESVNEPVQPKPISIVDVDPSQLGEFIASRAAAGSGDNSDGSRTRRQRSDSGVKRGRKSRKEAPQNIEALVTMVHTWASVLLKTPELQLDASEVKQLSSAYETFTEYHEVPILTPKRMSEINLISTALIIYGTRFVAVRNRRKNEKRDNVTQMPNRVNIGH